MCKNRITEESTTYERKKKQSKDKKRGRGLTSLKDEHYKFNLEHYLHKIWTSCWCNSTLLSYLFKGLMDMVFKEVTHMLIYRWFWKIARIMRWLHGKRRWPVENHEKEKKWLTEKMRYVGSVSLVYGEVDKSDEAYERCDLVYEKVDESNEAYGNMYWCMKKRIGAIRYVGKFMLLMTLWG